MTDAELPRYTRWADVPEGLYTRTQLAGMDPPRRMKRDARPRGRVLYHGNRYALLFHIDDTEPKPAASAKQRAAAARARELQHVCRWCGHVDDEPLGRGRLCRRCRAIRAVHRCRLDARKDATRLLRPTTVAAAVVSLPEPAGWIAVGLVAAADDTALGRWRVDPNGAYEQRAAVLTGMQEVLERAGALHPEKTVVWHPERGLTCTTPARCDLLCWDIDQWQAMRRLRLADPVLDARDAYPPGGGSPDYALLNAQDEQQHRAMRDWPRLANLGERAQYTYARWWGEYNADGVCTGNLTWNLPLPGAAGTDPVADARALLAVVRGVADGTAAVAPTAPWRGLPVGEVTAR